MSTKPKQRGNTFVGIVIGLVIGLAAAIAVVVYVTKVPILFVNKGSVPKSDDLAPKLQRLKGLVDSDGSNVKQGLKDLVPEYSGVDAAPVSVGEPEAAPARVASTPVAVTP